MLENVAGFDWDEGNWPKCGKHGLSKAEIESLFCSEFGLFDDPAHGEGESRFKAIGRSSEGRHIFAVFTVRKRDGRKLIRPISARYMHRKEIDAYEKT